MAPKPPGQRFLDDLLIEYLSGNINRDELLRRADASPMINYQRADLDRLWKGAGFEGVSPYFVPPDMQAEALESFDLGDKGHKAAQAVRSSLAFWETYDSYLNGEINREEFIDITERPGELERSDLLNFVNEQWEDAGLPGQAPFEVPPGSQRDQALSASMATTEAMGSSFVERTGSKILGLDVVEESGDLGEFYKTVELPDPYDEDPVYSDLLDVVETDDEDFVPIPGDRPINPATGKPYSPIYGDPTPINPATGLPYGTPELIEMPMLLDDDEADRAVGEMLLSFLLGETSGGDFMQDAGEFFVEGSPGAYKFLKNQFEARGLLLDDQMPPYDMNEVDSFGERYYSEEQQRAALLSFGSGDSAVFGADELTNAGVDIQGDPLTEGADPYAGVAADAPVFPPTSATLPLTGEDDEDGAAAAAAAAAAEQQRRQQEQKRQQEGGDGTEQEITRWQDIAMERLNELRDLARTGDLDPGEVTFLYAALNATNEAFQDEFDARQDTLITTMKAVDDRFKGLQTELIDAQTELAGLQTYDEAYAAAKAKFDSAQARMGALENEYNRTLDREQSDIARLRERAASQYDLVQGEFADILNVAGASGMDFGPVSEALTLAFPGAMPKLFGKGGLPPSVLEGLAQLPSSFSQALIGQLLDQEDASGADLTVLTDLLSAPEGAVLTSKALDALAELPASLSSQIYQQLTDTGAPPLQFETYDAALTEANIQGWDVVPTGTGYYTIEPGPLDEDVPPLQFETYDAAQAEAELHEGWDVVPTGTGYYTIQPSPEALGDIPGGRIVSGSEIGGPPGTYFIEQPGGGLVPYYPEEDVEGRIIEGSDIGGQPGTFFIQQPGGGLTPYYPEEDVEEPPLMFQSFEEAQAGAPEGWEVVPTGTGFFTVQPGPADIPEGRIIEGSDIGGQPGTYFIEQPGGGLTPYYPEEDVEEPPLMFQSFEEAQAGAPEGWEVVPTGTGYFTVQPGPEDISEGRIIEGSEIGGQPGTYFIEQPNGALTPYYPEEEALPEGEVVEGSAIGAPPGTYFIRQPNGALTPYYPEEEEEEPPLVFQSFEEAQMGAPEGWEVVPTGTGFFTIQPGEAAPYDYAPLRTAFQGLYGEGAPEIPMGTFGALAQLPSSAMTGYLQQYQQRAQPTDYGAAQETFQGLFPRANIPTGALEQFGRLPGGISALTSALGQRQQGRQFTQPRRAFRPRMPGRVEA